MSGFVEQLQQLRNFVDEDASLFSESDLATCLRQSGYNMTLAAERLMTGQFRPTRKRALSSNATTTTASTSSSSSSTLSSVKRQRSPVSAPPVTPSPRPPSKPATPKNSATRRTSKTPLSASKRFPQSTTHIPKSQHCASSTNQSLNPPPGSWLICHRWYSQATCLQRHGSLDYQEAVSFPSFQSESKSSCYSRRRPKTLRFQARSMQGQLAIPGLAPLVQTGCLFVQAESLMQERSLPMGAHVALSIRVYLTPNLSLFQGLDSDSSEDKNINNSHGNASTATTTSTQDPWSRAEFRQDVMDFLQWAQCGDDIPLSTAVSVSSSSVSTTTTSNSASGDSSSATEKNEDDVLSPEGVPPLQRMAGALKVELRPYQQEALWWMTQREMATPDDLSTASTTNSNDNEMETPTSDAASTRITCDCGPVQLDPTLVPAPPVEGSDDTEQHKTIRPIVLSEGWECRYLLQPDTQEARSFFIHPSLQKVRTTPPPAPEPCRGGILGDAMGLGKTVMFLSLIQSTSDKKDDGSQPGATLVVTPLSLLQQWQEEIESKTDLSYTVYYGQDAKQQTLLDLNVHVVLTTYGSLTNSPLLHHAWLRVILDEAHTIKNPSTQLSQACCRLQAQRRWCVTGTMVQNSIQDVFGLLKFLRLEPWCHAAVWNQLQQQERPLARVREILTPILLRRTKETLGPDGKPILTLPPVDFQWVPIEWSPAEKHFYRVLLRRSQSLFQGFLRDGTASKSWMTIFSLLHRLRQACDHVALTIKSQVDPHEWTESVVVTTKNETTPTKTKKDSVDDSFLNELLTQFRSVQTGDGIPTQAFEMAQKICDVARKSSSTKKTLNEECPCCLDPLPIYDLVITPCFHTFCKTCLVDYLKPKSNPSSSTLETGPCPMCSQEVDPTKVLRLTHSASNQVQTSRLVEPPKTSIVTQFEGVARQALEKAIRGSPSTKQTAILNELQQVWNEDPGSKVLIFSQFLGFLDLLEESFQTQHIPFARLDGSLSLKERMAVLQEFCGENQPRVSDASTSDKTGSVLLISMKAGGVGLNLVAARTVFIADPWWNAAVEDQCINRIHRIGQTGKVRVRKFYVKNSVEERIMAMQQRKKGIAQEVLSEDSSSEAARPTLEDIEDLLTLKEDLDTSSFLPPTNATTSS
eukprot:Nitzschia sp. Nitz4//scaffold168_size48592//31392//34905//NITZ4_007053-RA/size48592-augustus-gene-0.23-mRNA-1//-1//CDS//3329538330//407//frame0